MAKKTNKKTKTMRTTLIGYDVSGTAMVTPWGGGDGEIEMKTTFLPAKFLSKDNVLRCVNDNGFGVQSINGAWVMVTEVYDNGGRGKTIDFETNSRHSQKLFDDRKHLDKIGATNKKA
jgi:hypothetical protein